MRRDLWRLATPLLAVGVSFVVVLIIGASSTGGSPEPTPSSTPSAPHSADLTIMAVAQPAGQGQPQNSQSALAPSATHSSSNGGVAIPGAQPTSESPSPSVSSPAASASPSTRVLPGESTVTVRNATTLRLVATNHLNMDNPYTIRVPVQSYLVCLRPPGDWRSASDDTLVLGSWICMAKQVGPDPTKVTFHLVPRSASASGAGQ